MMSLAVVYSRAMLGMNAPLVTVETHLTFGLPAFSIVGLPEAVVRESRDRVRSALINSHFSFPDKRITVNLAPADLPKQGSRFDLPIAIGILGASGQLPLDELNTYEFIGELALSGALRSVQGVLPFALKTREAGRKLFIPSANVEEASLVPNLLAFHAESLLAVSGHLRQENVLTPITAYLEPPSTSPCLLDLAEVNGQEQAKRALEIAAAGGHSLLMSGPPGTGKTMLASRLPSILPPLTETERLEITALYSIAKQHNYAQLWSQDRPFRSPHHTASSVALVGGGRPPAPGEISLAHQGILFLDELPEFDRRVLETLREPLESGSIHIARAGISVQFPARFQLIAAMNPCPCGYYGSDIKACRCSSDQIQRYQAKLSGPFLDRIDLHVGMSAQAVISPTLDKMNLPENSQSVRSRVLKARERQRQRTGYLNAHLGPRNVLDETRYEEGALDISAKLSQHFNLSVRSYHRLLRVATTISDLDNQEKIRPAHVQEAIQYRLHER